MTDSQYEPWKQMYMKRANVPVESAITCTQLLGRNSRNGEKFESDIQDDFPYEWSWKIRLGHPENVPLAFVSAMAEAESISACSRLSPRSPWNSGNLSRARHGVLAIDEGTSNPCQLENPAMRTPCRWAANRKCPLVCGREGCEWKWVERFDWALYSHDRIGIPR